MKIEVLSDKENPLLGRREVKFKAHYTGPVPSVADVRKELIGHLKSKADLTVVDTIKPTFGATVASCYAKVYDSPEAMKIESKYMVIKNFGKEEEKPAAKEAVAEAPKE